jgi:hypothetical protein
MFIVGVCMFACIQGYWNGPMGFDAWDYPALQSGSIFPLYFSQNEFFEDFFPVSVLATCSK